LRDFFSRKITGFSLTELVIVIIILGILVAIAIPRFLRTKESAIDREAMTNLSLIYSAERIYYLRHQFYIAPGTGIAAINADLGLDLNENNFDYSVTGGGVAYTASAARSIYCSRTWSITQAGGNPSCNGGTGCCP